jgi:chemotaxis protein MotB
MKLVRWGASLVLAGFVGVALSGCGYSVVKKNEMQDLKDNIADLKQQNDQASSNLRQLQNENAKLQSLITEKTTTISTTTAMMKTTSEAVDLLKQQLAAAEKRADEIKAKGGIAGVDMGATSQGVVLKMKGEILFDPGKAILKKGGEQTLDKVAQLLKDEIKKQPTMEIRVAGFTDSDPIKASKWEDNLELSGERAREVLKYLGKKGVPESHMYFAGYGSHRLVMAGGKEDKASSRRVEILLATGGQPLEGSTTVGKEAPEPKKEPATAPKGHTPPAPAPGPAKKGPPTK